MPPGKTYTEARKTPALALYETDGPTAVEKQLGIPKNTVAAWAKRSGVRTVRTETTRAAVEAKVVDGKLRRQELCTGCYGQAAQKILDDLEGSRYETLIRRPGRHLSRGAVDPGADVRGQERNDHLGCDLRLTATTAKLEAVDSDNGVAGAVSMLDRLVEQIGGTEASGGLP